MRSRKTPFAWLLEKEWRELITSRSSWALLLVMGPLVAVSFNSAIHTYSELSALTGTAGAAGDVLSPLVGVWAPTFSACELAAVFLLPFVAIRLVAQDRQSGALKLEAQHSISPFVRLSAKAVVALLVWLIAMLAPLSSILLWKSYGGSTYAPEILAVMMGHTLNAGLTIALGAATASITEHPSTAAILTLSATVGTWIVSFFAAIHGGIWERIASYTPAAMVSDFQHGLIRLDSTLLATVLIFGGLTFAAIWVRMGTPVRRRLRDSIITGAVLAAAVWAITNIPAAASWDVSENGSNSFAASDERALKQIHEPLTIEAHLAAEDPRRADLERRTLSKLRRVLPNLHVNYISSTSTGLLEQASSGYGEITYRIGSRSATSRVVTTEGVLETIYSLAGVAQPSEDDAVFRGHPLTVQPKGASAVFYGFWPALVLIAGWATHKRMT